MLGDNVQMAKITIDGKEYDTEKLPKEALDLIASIGFVDEEMTKLTNQLKIYQIARNFYVDKLKEILNTANIGKNDRKLKF